MRDQLFRKEALARLSSPEQLDTLMQVTSPRGWLGLAALATLLVAAFVWSIFGTITTRVRGEGILLREGGVLEVATLSGGRVTAMNVETGDEISAGEVVAEIDQPEIVARLETERAELARDRGTEVNAPAIAAAEKRIQLLQNQLSRVSKVITPYDGKVLEVRTGMGRVVAPGTAILSIESTDAPLEALIYVPSGEGKKVRSGMLAQVSPSTVPKEEYGVMDGRVASISAFPATQLGMMHVLANEALVHNLSGSGAPLEVHASLVPDRGSGSGFRWSSGEGPPEQIESGTLCTATVIVRKQRPISLVLPYLREKSGI